MIERRNALEPQVERESLKDEMRNVIEEARMVLPGIQALFGFQTAAVFNNRFTDLPAAAVFAHLLALGLLTLSIALVMAPAAYHRLAERGQVSRHMIMLSSRLISAAMVPLMGALALDTFVVVVAVMEEMRYGVIAAAGTLLVCSGLWFAFPLHARKRKEAGS